MHYIISLKAELISAEDITLSGMAINQELCNVWSNDFYAVTLHHWMTVMSYDKWIYQIVGLSLYITDIIMHTACVTW